jgi:hypothetical protein
MQAQKSSFPDYEEWPVSQSEREELAQSVLGQHLVAVYDSWVDTAKRTLRQSYQPKSPTSEQQDYLQWIVNMNDDERHCALSLIQEITTGMVFSILNVLDNNRGSILQNKQCERVRVLLDIMPRDDQGHCVKGKPVETIDLNGEGKGFLYERWLDWLEDYSREAE